MDSSPHRKVRLGQGRDLQYIHTLVAEGDSPRIFSGKMRRNGDYRPLAGWIYARMLQSEPVIRRY